MNKYYHPFDIGFNTWYILAPAFILVAFVLGRLCVRELRKSRREVKIKRTSRFNDSVVCFIMAACIFCLVIMESFDGILQSWDNTIGTMRGDPSGFYALCLAWMTPGVIASICYGVYWVTLRVAKGSKVMAYKDYAEKAGASFKCYRMRTLVDTAIDFAKVVAYVSCLIAAKVIEFAKVIAYAICYIAAKAYIFVRAFIARTRKAPASQLAVRH